MLPWLFIFLGILYGENVNGSVITWHTKQGRVLIEVYAEIEDSGIIWSLKGISRDETRCNFKMVNIIFILYKLNYDRHAEGYTLKSYKKATGNIHLTCHKWGITLMYHPSELQNIFNLFGVKLW